MATLQEALYRNRFLRFCALGGVNTLIHMAVASLQIELLAMRPVLANVGAYLVANLVSFFANARLTFGVAPDIRRYPHFLAVSLFGFAASTTMVALSGWLGIHYLVAIAIGAVISALIGFFMSARLVFAGHHRDR